MENKFKSLVTEFASSDTKGRKKVLTSAKALSFTTNPVLSSKFKEEISDFLQSQCYIKKEDVTFLSTLIVETVEFRNILIGHIPTLFCKILHFLEKNTTELDVDDITYAYIKLCLQILQHYKVSIHALVLDKNDFKMVLTKIIKIILVSVIDQKSTPNDLAQLGGTVIGYILDYFPNTHLAAKSFILLLNGEGTDDINLVEIFPNIFLETCLSPVSELWIIIGVISCCNPSILFHQVLNLKVFQVTFEKLLKFCKDENQTLQYHGFRGMLIWWKAYRSLLLLENVCLQYMEKDLIIAKSLKMIWENWDNPIKGILDKVLLILDSMLEVDKESASNCSLLQICLDHALSTSIYVKGRYSVLSVLIKEQGYNLFLQENPSFFCTVLPCLAINHLAPIVSRIYKSCMQAVLSSHKDEKLLSLWQEFFAPSLMKALLCKSNHIVINALHYWVTPSLILGSDIYNEIMLKLHDTWLYDNLSLEKKVLCLSAILGVMKCARINAIVSFSQLDQRIFISGITSFDNNTRSDAWSLLCKGNKPSEIISKEEFSLVTEYLPLNMNCDSVSFRNELSFSINIFTQRILATLSSSLKKVQQNNLNEYCEDCMSFLRWLIDQCKTYLRQIGSYQRRHTALSIYKILLHSLLPIQSKNTKSILPHSELEKVLMLLKEIKATLVNSSDAAIFVRMLKDVVPEIREMAVSILLDYFPKNVLKIHLPEMHDDAIHLLESPKSQDAESGATIIQLIFKISFFVKSQAQDDKENHKLQNIISYLNKVVMKNIYKHFKELQENYLQASFSYPLFGWLLALSKCSDVISNCINQCHINNVTHAKLCALLSSIVTDICTIVHFTLIRIFSCVKDDTYIASADFKEIHSRIFKLISRSSAHSQSDLNKDLFLTKDYDVILSCSWLCMKNSCKALSSVAMLCIKMFHSIPPNFVVTMLQQICQLFVSILTFCRHQGIVESCSDCLTLVCIHLFASNIINMQTVAIQLIDTVFDLFTSRNVGESVVCCSTITRRSAGLPFITEAILSASVISKRQPQLIAKTFHTMITCVETLLNAEESDANGAELLGVHALYILKHLFQNTTLRLCVTPYAVTTFKLGISCLNHDWAVRNAGTQLLSVVANKMLGQKHIEEKHFTMSCNSLSVTEFFSWYPELLNFMLEVLEKHCTEITCESKKCIKVNPGVYPILSIISKLYNKQETFKINKILRLSKCLKILVQSPCYLTRITSVKAILNLHSLFQIVDMACNFMENLPTDNTTLETQQSVKQNSLHGWLEVIIGICGFKDQQQNISELAPLFLCCMQRGWIAFNNPCLLTAATYIAVVVQISKSSLVKTYDLYFSKLIGELQLMMEQIEPEFYKQAAAEIFVEKVLKLFFDYKSDFAISDNSILWKTSATYLSKENFLKCWLQKYCSRPCGVTTTMASSMATNIFALIKTNTCNNILLEFFITVCSTTDILIRFEYEILLWVTELLSRTLSLSTKCLTIKAISVMLATTIPQMEYDAQITHQLKRIKMWSQEIVKHTSKFRASEPLRLSSASALAITGLNVLNYIKYIYLNAFSEEYQQECMHIASNVYVTAIYLLNDEQHNIRKEACLFASKMSGSQSASFCNNISIQYILKDAVSRFGPQFCILDILCDFITEACISNNSADRAGSNLFDQEPFNPFFEPIYIAQMFEPYIKDLLENLILDSCAWIDTNLNKATQSLKQLQTEKIYGETKVWLESVFCILTFIKLICLFTKCNKTLELKEQISTFRKVKCFVVKKLVEEIEVVIPS